MQRMVNLQIVSTYYSENFAKLTLFDKSFLIYTVSVCLTLKHFFHPIEANISRKPLLLSRQKFHEFLFSQSCSLTSNNPFYYISKFILD